MKLIIDIDEYTIKAMNTCLIQTEEIQNAMYDAIANGIPYEEKPQGEWKLNKDENPECPYCHHSFIHWGNFCSNCGADMKGGDNK